MKKKFYFFTLITLFIGFIGCNEEQLEDQNPDKISIKDILSEGDYNDGKNIDFSVFKHLGEEYVNSLWEAMYGKAQTKANGFPNGVENILISPNKPAVDPKGATYTVLVDGDNYDPLDIRVSVYQGAELVSGQVTTVTNQTTLAIPAYYNPTNPNLRTLAWEYKDRSGEWILFNIFHQFPTEVIFNTNLPEKEHLLSGSRDTVIITKGSSYPEEPSQSAYFRGYYKNASFTAPTAIVGPFTTFAELIIPPLPAGIDERAFTVQWSASTGADSIWVDLDYAIQLNRGAMATITDATIVGGSILYPYAHTIRVNVNGEGNLGDVWIKAVATTHSYLFATGTPLPYSTDSFKVTVTSPGAGYVEIPILAVGPYDGWTPRYEQDIRSHGLAGSVGTWVIQYDNGIEWAPIATAYNNNFYYLGVENLTDKGAAPNPIGNATGVWNLKVYGNYRDGTVKFRAVNESGQDVSFGRDYTCPNPGSKYVPSSLQIDIEANPLQTERRIYLEYQIAGENVWRNWGNASNLQTSGWEGEPYIIQLGY